MKRVSPRIGRTALTAVVLSVLVTAVELPRAEVFFHATFDHATPGLDATAPEAEVGAFKVESTPGMFKTLPDGEDGGVLAIYAHDAGLDGELVARLDPRFVGTELRTRMTIQPLQTKANLTVRVEDDDEGVMIDIGWKDGIVDVGAHGDTTNGTPGSGSGGGGSGGGTVGGGGSGGGSSGGGSGGTSSPPGFVYEAGVEYDVTLTLRSIPGGNATYVLSLKWGHGNSYTIGGGLPITGNLHASKLRFIREANGKHGVFLVDDVLVTSTEVADKP